LAYFEVECARIPVNWDEEFLRGVNAKDRDVFARLGTDDFGFESLLVVQRYREPLRVGYDMVVGNNMSIRIPNESGASSRRYVLNVASEVVHDYLALSNENARIGRFLKNADGIAFILGATSEGW
jgi:hypothetical protein